MACQSPPSNCRPVVVGSHPRSGTHLLIDALRRQFEECQTWKWPGERLDRLYCNVDEMGGGGLLDAETARRILGRADRPVVKTHAWPGYQDTFLGSQPEGLASDWVEWLDRQGTIFYIYRDGRDVLCSYQLFRQKFDPDAEGPLGAFIRQEEEGTNRVRRWVKHVRSWLSVPNVHAVQFERLLDQPETVIQDLADELELDPTWREPLLPRPFQSIWESRWARLVLMQPESTAIINGTRQQWQDVFSADDRQFFQREAGDVLIDLGYVDSAAWVDTCNPDPGDPAFPKASQ